MSNVFKQVQLGWYLPKGRCLRRLLFSLFLFRLTFLGVHFFNVEQVLVGIERILLLEFLWVESVLHLYVWLTLLVLLVVKMHGTFSLFEWSEVDLQNLFYVRILRVGNFVDPIQKFLGMRSYLSRISCADVIFNLLPVLSVLSKSLNEAPMLFVSPSALTQSTMIALREVRLLSTLIIHSLVDVVRCVFH